MIALENLDLPYLATCVLQELTELGHLTGVDDEEDGRTSEAWVRAQSAAVLALQKGLAHLAQEEGEWVRSRIRLRGFEG